MLKNLILLSIFVHLTFADSWKQCARNSENLDTKFEFANAHQAKMDECLTKCEKENLEKTLNMECAKKSCNKDAVAFYVYKKVKNEGYETCNKITGINKNDYCLTTTMNQSDECYKYFNGNGAWNCEDLLFRVECLFMSGPRECLSFSKRLLKTTLEGFTCSDSASKTPEPVPKPTVYEEYKSKSE